MSDPTGAPRREITPPGPPHVSPFFESWRDAAACTGLPTDLFFVECGGSLAPVRNICADCPVRTDCLEWAVARGEHGFWGGTTEDERREMRKQRRKAVAA